MTSMIQTLEELLVTAYAACVVTVPEIDAANDAWKRMSELFLSRKHQVMEISAAHGLNPGAMNALLFLQPDEPCSMRTLADAWKCDASNVTWLVDRLEEHGLAERRPHPTDRRVRTVALTRKGVKVRGQIEAKLYEAPDFMRDLSARDLDTLYRILSKIAPAEPPRPA